MRIVTLPGVFRPRSDSWLLARLVRPEIAPGDRVLDLCTGSGVIAVSAAQKGAEAHAVDVSRRAVWTARLNARLNGARVDARRGDLFAAVDGDFDLITSNPPYLPADDDALPTSGPARAWDAGRDGRAVLDRICADAPGRLRPGGSILLIHSNVAGIAETRRALADGGLEVSIVHAETGEYGPLMAARVAELRRRGVLGPGEEEQEEMVVIRGRRPVATGADDADGASASAPAPAAAR
ncbi:HemK2/MTQ2 family protein methyltransferase [Patulibacter sp. SYSU D01012]|uniref:HemK2/MTQ2 family protein methyltransferase n=1 Tax=Patulibacter sp. SYSU D01012 TaxID=2817381 RepID=UPI001B315BB9|nr:HemK2/MTQ2 family protein methyltransferase [Patulibacter sp. SYSU D01012]